MYLKLPCDIPFSDTDGDFEGLEGISDGGDDELDEKDDDDGDETGGSDEE